MGSARTSRFVPPESREPPPSCEERLPFLENIISSHKMTPKDHIHLWLPIRVGEELFVDMSLVSEHALQCLGQSPLYNFLLSQAAGFIIPNPKRVVSSTPGIFQRQSETQPSPRWGVEPFSQQVCRSTGSLPSQMSWSAAADCSCHPWGQPLSAPRIKRTL